MTNPHGKTVGLALSGGGFRATLFNLGSVWRLNDAGMLPQLDRVTSVSGGSITAAVLGHRWKRLRFGADGVAANFADEIAAPLREFCTLLVDAPALVGIINPFGKVSDAVAKKYDRKLFNGAKLADLPNDKADEGPRFILYATNLQTGTNFRFSRPYLADWHLGIYEDDSIPIARAVAASSAFPPVLSPVILKTDPAKWTKGPPNDSLYQKLRKRIVLTDGGVYDNMGLEAIWDRCEVVLVSDAGGPFAITEKQNAFWGSQLPRVRNIMMEQTRALRRRMVMIELTSGRKSGAFWGTKTKIDDFELADAMTKDSARSAALKDIRTRLNPFKDREQGELINWGYALADAALRKHVDPAVTIGSWPVPEYAFG